MLSDSPIAKNLVATLKLLSVGLIYLGVRTDIVVHEFSELVKVILFVAESKRAVVGVRSVHREIIEFHVAYNKRIPNGYIFATLAFN